MTQHVVIQVIAEGDEITPVGVFDDAMEAIHYAKKSATEYQKGFYEDMHAEWKAGHHPDMDEPIAEKPKEKFHVFLRSEYIFEVEVLLGCMPVTYIAQPVA